MVFQTVNTFFNLVPDVTSINRCLSVSEEVAKSTAPPNSIDPLTNRLNLL